MKSFFLYCDVCIYVCKSVIGHIKKIFNAVASLFSALWVLRVFVMFVVSVFGQSLCDVCRANMFWAVSSVSISLDILPT